MKKHSLMRETRVIPRAMVPHANGEAARCGEAAVALNVREQLQSLQVTGQPAGAGAIAVGDRLLLISGDHRVTSQGSTVKIDNQPVATVQGRIVGAHDIGPLVVIVSQDGFTYLSHDSSGSTWTVLNPADAVPQLSITARMATMSADIDAYDFVTPYAQWRAPLADADATALAAMLRSAWNALQADAAAEGRYTSPVLVRWAVRLKDDTYLWMSDPVRVGDETLANADRIAATVNAGSDGFTGTQRTLMPLLHYGLDIEVTRGIAAQWLPLVAGIDVFVTHQPQLLTASRRLDYRCITRTTGPREYVLEMGLERRSATAVTTALHASSWQLVARAQASGDMAGSDFVPPLEALTLTRAQCAAIGQSMQVDDGALGSTAAGGRLYCCTTGGDIVVSVAGNALVEAHRRSVLGAEPLALAVVTRPLYSGGFGRYPVYVFTGDGIFAIPQSAMGSLGEARLVDRTVMDPAVQPVEGDGGIWFVSRHGHLCSLRGARVTVHERDVDCLALAWCNAHGELWRLPRHGNPLVTMPSGALSERSVDAVQLYCDPRHAMAVTPAGRLLDLEREQEVTCPVRWQSHPVAIDSLMGQPLCRLVWHVRGRGLALTLQAIGQRGIMALDVDVSRIVVNGDVEQPLATPTVATRMRTLRLDVSGMASTGTLLLPCLVYTCR